MNNLYEVGVVFMEAIILVGGYGKRLSHIISDVPKPMAPVNGRPFLEYILDELIDQGITKVTLAVGYKREIIENYFKNEYKGIKVIYSIEDTPLFTGGAIKKALSKCNNDHIFIINGDTFFKVNLKDMQDYHIQHCADITVAKKLMHNFDRYGTVECLNKRIIKFHEKKLTESGYINGGVYLLKKDVLACIKNQQFSFELDIMGKMLTDLNIYAYKSKGYFIDIGIPEDYHKAQVDFKNKSLGYISWR